MENKMLENQDLNKKLEKIEHQRGLVEAELAAVRLSKAYKIAKIQSSLANAELAAVRLSKSYKITKILTVIKNKIQSDPVGLMKKFGHIIINDPKKLTHVFRSVNRINFMAQTAIDQNNKYQEWILLNEPDEKELEMEKTLADNLKYRPLISIITPVFNPPVDVLEALIESILDQTYSNFELYLGNFGDSKEVISVIEKYTELDNRIKHRIFVENKGIAANSNQILKKISGEYLALLDHDDTLSPNALYENVKKLNEGDYDFIYSDKDKIDILGNRFSPLFKPQFSPEMMLNINYLTHLNVMKTSIVKEIGGWDSSTDGAQDWDIFLRFIEKSKKIAHIPKILYHWRVIESSTAMSIESKPYALAGQRRAIDKYLENNNIPAKSYHKKTELFLNWNSQFMDKNPLVYIYFSNTSNTLRIMRHIKDATENPSFIILVDRSVPISGGFIDIINRPNSNAKLYKYNESTLFRTIGKSIDIKNDSNCTVLFVNDMVQLPKNDWYNNLTGWLTINGVVAVSGRLVDKSGIILDSGAIINKNSNFFPIFSGYPKFYESFMGNSEWVRNLSILSSNFIATKSSEMIKFDFLNAKKINYKLDDYFLWARNRGRLLMTPHVTATINANSEINIKHVLKMDNKKTKSFIDCFGNPNMSAENPLCLFSETAPSDNRCVIDTGINEYQRDAMILANSFDITDEEIENSINLSKSNKIKTKPNSVAWILPSYDAVYAGLMNIFTFANYLNSKKNLNTTFYILKNTEDVRIEKEKAVKAFSGLKSAQFVGMRPDEISKINKHDIGIATQWATAYPLAKTANIIKKCYFIQDNEVNFYPKGSISSLVELSYRFGFNAIANTEGLLDMYEKVYNGKGIVLKSVVNLNSYSPRKDIYYIPKPPYKVFFYARPNMPRNAFELGIAGLKRLKEQLGDDVEIITAGAEFNSVNYGIEGLFTNLGKIDYDAVPRLYKSIDAGLMFMFSGHPGVTASELMASGCPVVVNEYDDVTWHELYKNEITCLTTKSTASEVARNIRRCLEDNVLRAKIIDGGIKVTKNFYSGYEESCETAYNKLIK